jgi:hypothetical protein
MITPIEEIIAKKIMNITLCNYFEGEEYVATYYTIRFQDKEQIEVTGKQVIEVINHLGYKSFDEFLLKN